MSPTRWIAVSLLAMTLLLCAVAMPGLIDAWGVRGSDVWGFEGLGIVAAVVFGGAGALLASRRPENPVGWLFALGGLAFATLTAVDVYAGVALIEGRDGGVVYPLSWFSSWGWIFFMGCITFAVLLFPSGGLPGPRWRIPAYLMGLGFAIGAVGFAFSPGPLNNFPEHITNRYAFEPGLFADVVSIGGMFCLVFSIVAAAVAVVTRFRASHGVQRQQMKLFAFAAGVMGASFLLLLLSELGAGVPGDLIEIVSSLAMMAIPVAMTIAILRYRLYDIDVLINRTVVYLLLTGLLALAYFGIVAVLQPVVSAVAGGGSEIAVAASTLAVAALFAPLRRWLQDWIDHLFYRRKYDASRALDDFAGKLRDEIDLDTLTRELLDVVDNTMKPAHASLWLRPTIERRWIPYRPGSSPHDR